MLLHHHSAVSILVSIMSQTPFIGVTAPLGSLIDQLMDIRTTRSQQQRLAWDDAIIRRSRLYVMKASEVQPQLYNRHTIIQRHIFTGSLTLAQPDLGEWSRRCNRVSPPMVAAPVPFAVILRSAIHLITAPYQIRIQLSIPHICRSAIR